MSDTNNLVMEELRTIKQMHNESVSKLGELCGEVRSLVVELRHTQKGFDDLSDRIAESERKIHAIQIENATNKPILEIARSMNRNMWLTMGGALFAVAGTNLDKFIGG